MCEVGLGAWLLAHPVILLFCLSLNVFSIALRTRLDLSYLLVFGVSHCICSEPLDPMAIHLFLLHAWWRNDGLT
jgi:hypothetical protein